ncbi:MAG: sugar transferase [Lentisphaeria bacterium]|nr:sugar transferase [Lentisphaeria bacterium]
MYRNFFKRLLDFCLSFCAIVFLSPVLLVLTIVGAFKMKGNPFFTQQRPGKNERIFRLIKFRTMTCETDSNGNLLPDEKRLVPYGIFLRSTSLDELPELFNILKGDMSIVGPRPLLVCYLPRYNEEQRHRHDVRPGLTGYAQVNGRNTVTWEDKFRMDVEYTRNVTFINDMKIILETAMKVLKREGISGEGAATMTEFMGTDSKKEI